MTPDASLPPADVQRPTPPLTEEELAEMWERSDWGMGSAGIRRLIADLRAVRAEVERLRTQNAEYVAFIATVVRVPVHGGEPCGRKHLHEDEHTGGCRPIPPSHPLGPSPSETPGMDSED